MRKYEHWLGFGTISNPQYWIRLPRPENPHGKLLFHYSTTTTLHGTGVIIPYWFLVLLSGTVAALPHVGWPPRLSMRGMFGVMTFASVLLGLVAWLDLAAPR
jgi:hypothetical protein